MIAQKNSFNETSRHLDVEFLSKSTKKEDFLECIDSLITTPIQETNYELKSDEKWREVSEQWKSAKIYLNLYESIEKKLRDQLIVLSQNKSCRGNGVSVCKFVRQGNIDYKSIPILEGMDFSNYRKKPQEQWRILSE